VSDKKLTLFYTSADDVISKEIAFHRDWKAMIAGNDITQCVEIMEDSRNILVSKENTLTNVSCAVKTAFQGRLRQLIDDRHLSRYGMGVSDFRIHGKEQFTPETFNSICSLIDNTHLECEFLVSGFDKNKRAHIFTVTDPGVVNFYDKPGFWAIGSGASSALSMLFYRGQIPDKQMSETLYVACEAKFMAESASDVGKETEFFISKHGHSGMIYTAGILEGIRKQWEKYGQPKIPKRAVGKIKEANIRLTKPNEK
jgi:hypothetical protein